MGNRFRYIGAAGEEESLSDVPELVAAIASGKLNASSLLFDSKAQRWAPAADHDAFLAAISAWPQTSDSIANAAQSVPPALHRDESRESLSLIEQTVPRDPNDSAPKSLASELKALDDDLAAAKARGFDSDFLKVRYTSERRRIESELGVPASSSPPDNAAETPQAPTEKLRPVELLGWICMLCAAIFEHNSRSGFPASSGQVAGFLGELVAYAAFSALFLAWTPSSRRFWGWGALAMVLLAGYGRSG